MSGPGISVEYERTPGRMGQIPRRRAIPAVRVPHPRLQASHRSRRCDSQVQSSDPEASDSFGSKSIDLNRILTTIRNAMDKSNLLTETKVLKKKVSKKYEMIGNSPAIIKIKEMIDRVASTDARVLITGDNGTGKELVAHWIHEKSNRAKAPMVEVNCAAIPSELIESELFGHEKGSFTSAIKQKK